MLREYDDFELVFQPSGEDYDIQLLNSPAGQASGKFIPPFNPIELSNFYGRIGQRRGNTRSGDSPDLEAAKKFGDQLFHAVFTGELLGQLRTSVDRCHEHGRGLRIRLRLKGVPALAELPWEFLYDRAQNHFLATSATTPMVRYLDLPQSVPTLKVSPPLRVLVVLAGPSNLPRLDAEGEWERLKTALAKLETSGAIQLERLPGASLDDLRYRARGEPFHILHFIGHGGFDQAAGDGVLQFVDTRGMSNPVRGQFLGAILRDHDSLRLAILNACEGARQSDQDPFSGIAQSLCQQRLPAVVAMQFEISDDAAKTFAEEFYKAVAEGYPVDAAVSEARKALFTGRFGQEWATPVLYMRPSSGVLFDVQQEPKPQAVVQPVQPEPQQAPAPVQPRPASQPEPQPAKAALKLAPSLPAAEPAPPREKPAPPRLPEVKAKPIREPERPPQKAPEAARHERPPQKAAAEVAKPERPAIFRPKDKPEHEPTEREAEAAERKRASQEAAADRILREAKARRLARAQKLARDKAARQSIGPPTLPSTPPPKSFQPPIAHPAPSLKSFEPKAATSTPKTSDMSGEGYAVAILIGIVLAINVGLFYLGRFWASLISDGSIFGFHSSTAVWGFSIALGLLLGGIHYVFTNSDSDLRMGALFLWPGFLIGFRYLNHLSADAQPSIWFAVVIIGCFLYVAIIHKE